MAHQCSHVAGSLSQKNKPFKSRHSTKSELKRSYKKKKIVFAPRAVNLSKQERRNRAKQLKKNKQDNSTKKNLENNAACPPRLVVRIVDAIDTGLLSLSDARNVESCYEMLLEASGVREAQKVFWQTQYGYTRPIPLIVPNSKSRINLWRLDLNPEFTLDAIKVCDILVFVLPIAEESIDSNGRILANLLTSYGVPTCFGVAMTGDTFNGKTAIKLRKRAENEFQKLFTVDSKFLCLENQLDAANLLRLLGVTNCKKIWRDNWSYTLADQMFWNPQEDVVEEEKEFGTLSIVGYVRGCDFDCNSLVYANQIGEFQVDCVCSEYEIFPFTKYGMQAYDDCYNLIENHDQCVAPIELNQCVISKSDPDLIESLRIENRPSQNFQILQQPLRRELNPLRYKKVFVPKGTSVDQAYWYCYGDDEDDDQSSMDMVVFDEEQSATTANIDSSDDDEEHQLMHYDSRNNKIIVNDDDDDDDEVSLEDGQLAMDVYRDYRSLKSFRTSPWDPMENLPLDYSRIFQFRNFRKAQKNITSIVEKDKSRVKSGSYVKINIKDVHRSVFQDLYNRHLPWVFVNLHPFENKISVVNFLIKKSSSSEHLSVKSFDTFSVNIACRQHELSICFSEHNPKCDKHKLLKILPDDQYCIASAYAPITFTPAPILIWNRERTLLLATGSVYDCNPNRVILEKIMLSGKPYSIEGHRVVVRGMFNNPADVRYFQKVELVTKKNVNGYITESLGTKGYFKATFSAKINHGDRVYMPLYKRVFPTWQPFPQPPRTCIIDDDNNDDELLNS